MNLGDIKLMIDQLTCIDDGEADSEMLDAVITSLERLGNEYAALLTFKEQHEPIMLQAVTKIKTLAHENEIGKRMCGQLMAEIGLRNEAQVKLRAALTVCADQFDAYAEHHKLKMEDSLNGLVYREDAEVKYRRNRLLAFNARKAME